MNYKLRGYFGHYLTSAGTPWTGDFEAALRTRWNLARRGLVFAIECPNHGGAFDCTPFCEVCHGNQEIERETN